MVRIRLLGAVAAATDEGEPVDVGPAKCRAVLAVLALSVGEAVPVSRLVDVVWGGDAPRTAEKTLQGYIADLRKGLGRTAIVRTGASYRLDVATDAVDVHRFRRHVSAGEVEAALAEWTGTPLAGLDAPGLGPVIDGLVEQWLGAIEVDLERRVNADSPATVATLTQLTADHPFREGLWALLMTALYRSGRQADALAAYQRVRQHLVEELGVEPGPRLREVEGLILEHDERLHAQALSPGSAAAPRPTGTVTFGCCEVEAATQLWVEHRRKMAAAMAGLDALVRAAADRQGGTVVASGGESLGVAFHRADDAAAWATQLQAAVGEEPWPGGIDVRLRVGLHSGETEERDGGYFGAAVHIAERLAAAGHGGQTLVSGVTAAVLGRDDLRDLGTHRLDGVPVEQDVYQLGVGDHPPLRTTSARRGNLPRRLGRLLGRDGDLDTVVEALAGSPVVTLVGTGGIGKTTLALAAARRWQDDDRQRIWLVELAEIGASDGVPRAAADALGVTEGSAATLTGSVVAALRSRPTLLVLDNCEHVIDGAAALATAVAEDTPDTRVLATSREGMGIAGERLVAVGPLDPAGAAVELFAERAQGVSGGFDLDHSRSEVAEICRRLDGVPLAIELAAARTASLTPSQLLARLDDRLRLLTGGRRTGADRHRTLRATIEWSYDLLSPAQRLLFQRLAVFTGPFDLAAAEAVAASNGLDTVDVDHLLGDLVERSMVAPESGPFGRRFRLLETLRHFAAEQLAAQGKPEGVARRHAWWCRDQVAFIHSLLTGPGEVEGVARLGELWPNLRTAVDWACMSGDAALADALVRPIAPEVNLRRQAEIGDWAERILQLTSPDDEDGVVFWLTWAAERHTQAGNRAAYERVVGRHGRAGHPLIRYAHASQYEDDEELGAASPAAVAWLRERGEGHAASLIEVTGVASGLMVTGRLAELDAVARAMADRYRQGPPTLLYFAWGLLGFSAKFHGRHEDSARFFAEAAGIDVPAGTYLANRTVEARAVFDQGERSRAFAILRDHVDTVLDTDYVDVARMIVIEFVYMMAAVDRLTEAARVLTYLDTTGGFGELARETLLADAVSRIAAAPEVTEAGGDGLGARQALAYMRQVLDDPAVDS
ncbi:MAG: AfsR/SARP family transcriptional regulator [Pseudonocardiaceae bacterium]|nr:AfsR/SARP family transcriptional regulator [Pseudonocardiaceae bacterium]